MKLSDMIGKQVFSIYDTSFIGTINDVAFDKSYNKILGLYFFDNEENEYFINIKNIFSIKDYITIKNTTKINTNFILDNPLSPLGKKVIGVNGQDFGTLQDIEIDNYFNTLIFRTKNQSISLEKIMCITNVVMISNQYKISSFKPKKTNKSKASLNNLTVNIMQLNTNENNNNLMPPKITINTNTIIGKKITNNITNENNEIILKQNQVITQKHIFVAKQYNKLNELYLNCE